MLLFPTVVFCVQVPSDGIAASVIVRSEA